MFAFNFLTYDNKKKFGQIEIINQLHIPMYVLINSNYVLYFHTFEGLLDIDIFHRQRCQQGQFPNSNQLQKRRKINVNK